MSEFLRLLSIDVRPYTKKVEGASYIPWALALEMAGFPSQDVVTFDLHTGASLVRPLFNGGVVAVEQDCGNNRKQRVYLPLLDLRSNAIPYGKETARNVSDTVNRCRARATAVVQGLGLSLWTEFSGDGPRYAKALDLSPDAILRDVKELREVKKIRERGSDRVVRTQEYLGWHSALAAARITDPNFYWEVLECDVMDEVSGAIVRMPAMRVAGTGWVVGVRIEWKGRVHVEWLPIMGVEKVPTRNGVKPMEHQSVPMPSAFQWHNATMRCLAKAIALCTGYGIRCYTKELAVDLPDELRGLGEIMEPADEDTEASPDAAGTSAAATSATAARTATPAVPGAANDADGATADPEAAELVRKIREMIPKAKGDEPKFISWLGVESLDTCPIERLQVGFNWLEKRLQESKAAVA